MASMFREDMPWLYELGMEAYRAAKAGLPEETERAMRAFRRAMEFTSHGPFRMEGFGMHPKELHMLMHELEHTLMSEPPVPEELKEKPKRKKDEKEKPA